MTDRPILFSAPMVQALLAGRKTQTRRLARGSTRPIGGDDLMWRPSPWRKVQPGDRLWVREAFSNTRGDDSLPTYYQADAPLLEAVSRRFQPSIHMPRWASRLTLTVTDVRVQRLQAISEEDAVAEGIYVSLAMGGWTSGAGADESCDFHRSHPTKAFAKLWERLHGPGAWEANPEVVALTFSVAQRNINA